MAPDILDEIAREKMEKKDMVNSLLSTLDGGKRRIEIEEMERKRDFKRQKAKKEGEDYVPPAALKNASQELAISDRKKLVLPAPQVSEAELEELVKLGHSGEAARMMAESTGSQTPSTSFLISDTLGKVNTKAVPMRTPRVVSDTGDDILKQQARNLKRMTESQTPLLGGDIQYEGDLGFESGVTPNILSKAVKSTPNPLLAQLTPMQPDGVLRTPIGGNIRGKTPLRDSMGINSGTPFNSNSKFDETPGGNIREALEMNMSLQSMFATLPKPKNDFEIVIPSVEDEIISSKLPDIEADSEDLARDKAAKLKMHRENEQKLKSQVIQRELPRPATVSSSFIDKYYKPQSEWIDDMVSTELAKLVYHDSVTVPLSSHSGKLSSGIVIEKLEKFDYHLLSIANSMIESECEKLGIRKFDDKKLDLILNNDDKEKIDYKIMFSRCQDEMKKIALQCQKLEKKLGVIQGGHIIISKQNAAKLSKMWKDAYDLEMEVLKLDLIYELERGVLSEYRIDVARKWTEECSFLAQSLQDEYRNLSIKIHQKENETKADEESIGK